VQEIQGNPTNEMRQIKFRAAAKPHGKSIPAKGIFRYWNVLDSIPRSFVKETIGQFTGLKDNNGKEIYERDIVRCGEFDGDAAAKNWEVVFDDNYAEFDLRGSTGEVNGLSYWLNAGVVEVIGNIYENPNKLDPSYPSSN
jgi:uncharacterized phage protein (TIGR01671 family)